MVEWCRRDSLVHQSGFDAKYIQTINSLFARDYKGSRPFTNDSAALDLDSKEKDASGKNDCTMDCAIGICRYDGQSYSHEQMLLVEFRYDYKSSHNLDHVKMSRKVCHSKQMLTPMLIHDSSVFIFEDSVAPEARNWINNYSNQYSEMKSWQVMNVKEFNDFVGEEGDFPYVPVTNLACIDKEIRDSAQDGYMLMSVCKKWLDLAFQFKVRYKLREVEAIAGELNIVLEEIVSEGNNVDLDVVAWAQEELSPLTTLFSGR